MNKAKIIIAVVLAVIILIVVLQNTEAVDTRLLFTTITMPRAALLFMTFVIGFVVGMLTAGRIVWKPRTSKDA